MISDITIGQYFPGNSVIHKMDARMKIILTLLLIVSIFLCKNIVSLLAVVICTVLLVLISKISLKTVFKSIKPLALIIIITSLLNLFYGRGEPLVQLGRLKITQNGIETAVFMAIRIITLVIISSLLTYTTSPTELTDALERLLKPLKLIKVDVHSIAMTMTIALRFIPTLIEEITRSGNGFGRTDSQGKGSHTRYYTVVYIIFQACRRACLRNGVQVLPRRRGKNKNEDNEIFCKGLCGPRGCNNFYDGNCCV